eukprot:GSMAST32.ASY1.ANO1.812.1 assembled CDS
MSSGNGILDRPLSMGKKEVSLSAFAFMFSGIVRYIRARVPRNAKSSDLEDKLSEIGINVGVRVNELIAFRDTPGRRISGKTWDQQAVSILQYIHTTVWKSLFGKQADALEKSTDREFSYMITDDTPVTNKFVSSQVNCAAYLAGVIQGILMGANFPATVKAYLSDTATHHGRTTFLIQFHK